MGDPGVSEPRLRRGEYGRWDSQIAGGRTRQSGARSAASPQTATSAGPLHHWALPSCNVPLTHRPPQPNPSLKRKKKPRFLFGLGCECEARWKGLPFALLQFRHSCDAGHVTASPLTPSRLHTLHSVQPHCDSVTADRRSSLRCLHRTYGLSGQAPHRLRPQHVGMRGVDRGEGKIIR